jgi:hypothetical protein
MASSSIPEMTTTQSTQTDDHDPERLSPAELKAFLTGRYLAPDHHLPPLWLSAQITHWDENPLLDLARQESIYDFLYSQSSPLTTHLEFVFAGLEGDVVDCVLSSSAIGQPPKYSSDFIRGRSG